MAALWTTQQERSNPAVLSFFTWIALHLGRRIARLLLPPTVLYFVFAGGAARAASRNYLRRALGREATIRDGYRHVHAFASSVLDRLYFLNDRHDLFDIEVIGRDVIRDAMHAEHDGRRGAFVMGAHIGSFEAVRAAGRVEKNLRVSMVMYEDNARFLNDALAAINPRLAESIIALGRVDSMMRVKEALDDGHLVGMLSDRTLAEEANGSGVREAMLLGGRIQIPVGPFRMAAMMRRPAVFIVGLYRGGNRYEVHYETLHDFSTIRASEGRDRTQAMNDAIETAIQRYVARLEHFCTVAPYNWFNFYDYWNEAATGSSHQHGQVDQGPR